MTTARQRNLEALSKNAVYAIRKAIQAPNSAKRTTYYRNAADILVSLREFFLDERGNPDWRGKTWAYRDLVRDIYSQAGLDSDPNNTVKAAIRYHVGNALRERLQPEELETAKLAEHTPRDRQRARHSPEAGMPPEDIISTIYFLTERLTNNPEPSRVDTYTYNRAASAVERLNGWVAWQHKLITGK